MQGHAKISTFEHIGMDPATKPLLVAMLGADGKPKVCKRVWISSIGCAEAEQTGKLTAGFGATTEKIGPEFTLGIYMEKQTDAPLLLIKTSWGGKSLNTDFRPSGAGPYVFNEQQLAAFVKQGKEVATMQAEKEKATGVNYRLIVEHVKMVLGDIKRVVPGYDAAQGYEDTPLGVPQGGPLSSLLANIVLDPLDQELERRGAMAADHDRAALALVTSPKPRLPKPNPTKSSRA